MCYETTTKKLETMIADCIILPVYEKQSSTEIKALDKICHGKISKTIQQALPHADIGKVITLHHLDGSKAKSILLVGCGKKQALTVIQFRKILSATWAELKKLSSKKIICALHQLNVKSHDSHWCAKEIIIHFESSRYTFDAFKAKKTSALGLKTFMFACKDAKQASPLKNTIKEAKAIAAGIRYTKDLGNMPPNVCNPTYLAKQAQLLAKAYPQIKVNIIDEKEAKKMGMGSFCSVAQGSDQPGKIITISYKGGRTSQKPIALIGKGITFDTGGNDIKTTAGMYDMKYDMCGAATVFGVIKAAAEVNLKQNVIGIIASAENMINGKASRPTDIVKSLSGITIEITNTDAEGRLVLCDAMTYSRKFKPAEVISVATLTGAVIAAFAHVHTGLLSNNQALADDLLNAGDRAADPAWQLPLTEDYFPALDSLYADTINANLNRKAGTVTSACFLSKFAEGLNWAHLDIAGTSITPGHTTSASGRPVAMLMQYLFDKK